MIFRVHLDKLRRKLEELADQAWAWSCHKVVRRSCHGTFDGDPRFALLVVNFSTTRYLKLMLLMLADQHALGLLKRIVIVDNRSKDGGLNFLRELTARVSLISLKENRMFLNHARGMRSGLSRLEKLEASQSEKQRSNIVISCDSDIIFRDAGTLSALTKPFVDHGAAFAGELRYGIFPYPEAQASFIAVRRDCYARHDIAPWVNHGSPAYWMQRSIWKAGLLVMNFPSNQEGYILHRGRSGVAAARVFQPASSYASIANNTAHFMGIPGGEKIWAEVEARWAHLLANQAEPQLIEHLASRFGRGGVFAPT